MDAFRAEGALGAAKEGFAAAKFTGFIKRCWTEKGKLLPLEITIFSLSGIILNINI
jgi:hypothetical protein